MLGFLSERVIHLADACHTATNWSLPPARAGRIAFGGATAKSGVPTGAASPLGRHALLLTGALAKNVLRSWVGPLLIVC